MTNILEKNTLLIKEHVGMFKAANNYDVYDPEDGKIIMECREESLGMFTKMLRFTDYKRMTPFEVIIRDSDGKQIVRVARGVSIFLSKVKVYDQDDQFIGLFKQKLFTIGGAFTLYDTEENPVCKLKGKWTGWDFKFMSGETELAHVTKKWAGHGKELFSSADNYMLAINDHVPSNSNARLPILASVMCIDMVLKE